MIFEGLIGHLLSADGKEEELPLRCESDWFLHQTAVRIEHDLL